LNVRLNSNIRSNTLAVKIRLARHGKIRTPHYRIVVADSKTHRDGRVIEEIGRYVPTNNPSIIEVNSERARYWLGVGAQPTEQVEVLLKLTGDYQASKGDKNAKNTVQVAEPKAAFVTDAKKKTVLVPKSEIAAKKAAPVAEESAPAAEATESAEVAVDAVVDAPAEEAVAVEEVAAPVAEAVEEVAAEVQEPVAEATEATDAKPEEA
jgi:small subunit ribosomal protein S16